MDNRKRALWLLILLSALSFAVAITVMSFWYFSAMKDFQNVLTSSVVSQKKIFRIIYMQNLKYGKDKATSAAARFLSNNLCFANAIKMVSVISYHDPKIGYIFYISDKCEETDSGRGNRMVLKNIPGKFPASMGLSGKEGFVITKDHRGKDVLAAYSYTDINGTRFSFVSKTSRKELNRSKVIAAEYAAGIALLIIIFGGFAFYRVTAKSIDAMKKANKTLSRFGDIMNTLDEYIAYLDTDLRYVAANRKYQSAFNVNEADLIGKKFGALISKEQSDDLLNRLEICVKGERSVFQMWLHIPIMGRRFVDVKLTPFISDNIVEGVVITVSDRTDEELIKQDLLIKTHELETLTCKLEERVQQETEKRMVNEGMLLDQKKFADMGQMINAIAHQWRQPINSLGLYVQLVYSSIKDGTMDSELLESFKNDSLKLVQHMSKTIDDFRSFFDPRTNETDFEVVKALLDTISLVEAQLKNHGVAFSVSCRCPDKQFVCQNNLETPPCSNPHTLVRGFSSEFKQVILNIVQNAKDALLDKHDSRYINMAVEVDDEYVDVIISDNGGGIPKDVIDKVFNPYFTTKPQGKGTGIGLYMSKMIIEEHMKGSLTVSNDSEGAVFKIRLKKINVKS